MKIPELDPEKRGVDGPQDDFKPWEQRPQPGVRHRSGGGLRMAPEKPDEPPLPDRLCVEMPGSLEQMVDAQTSLVHYPMVNHFTTSDADTQLRTSSNRETWELFVQEQMYDTRRVTLEHFHLFEWFPLSPGRFHTQEAAQNREMARQSLVRAQGQTFFSPYGKADMIRGGVGTVRLKPRMIAGEPQYFMTASSNAVCHEGFPVLIPRRFYGPIKARINQIGAAPVTLSGEMRYLQGEAPSFFSKHRDIPQLFLHVDQLELLPMPRPEVKEFAVSAAISFVGMFDQREGMFATYATFDPAQRSSLEHAVSWMEKFYVTEQYKGLVVTDFDEVLPRFQGVVFGLPDLMAGKLNQKNVKQFLKDHGLSEEAGKEFFLVYKEINMQGGTYIEGNVYTEGGDLVTGNKTTGPSGE